MGQYAGRVAPQERLTYPEHWEADVVLRDGGTAHLRPIRPEDAEALQRFHLSQSPESVYLRFFAPMPRLSERDLERFTVVDHHDRVAMVITIAGDIVGVGRYDRVDATEAEVAFNISDHHHGRGVGSVLLEHLAAAAREHGIHRFMAEVLPQNRKMLAVFNDAGYEVTHRYEDGVISLGFDIDPTERSRAVMEAREHRAEASSMHAVLHPGSVVLIGASRREDTIGRALLAAVQGSGFTGALHVVHPEADSVLGIPAHRSLDDVPHPVDLAVVAVPGASVLEVVHDCAKAGVRGLVVVSGGFAEAGEEGLERQRELVRVARASGMRVVGPNSWGVINADPRVRLNISMRAGTPPAGHLGVFCQSGALSVAVLDLAARRSVGISTFVSAGNRADVSANDCLQYWEADDDTRAVGLYLESTGNPRKFARIARRISRSRPVVVLTSGTSGFSRHTTSRAHHAPPEAFDAMLSQTGCIRVPTLSRLFDVAQLLLDQPLPEGNRVAVVANSHALADLVADACLANRLSVVHGPVAVPELSGPGEFGAALQAALDDVTVDAVVAVFAPAVLAHTSEVADVLADKTATSRQPVVASLIGYPGRELVGVVEGARRVPLYDTPEEAVSALADVVGYSTWRRRNLGERVELADCDSEGAQAMVAKVLEQHPEGIELDPRRSAELLRFYGIEVWPSLAVSGPEDALEAAERLGWPVALKTTAAYLRHRVDLGGVRLDIADAGELSRDVVEMTAQLGPMGGGDLVVQKMSPAGVACVVRTVEDPQYGPVVSFGLGGDASELLGDLGHRIAPLTRVDIADMIRSVRASPKLFGHRGARPVDVGALEDLIARLSCLADGLPDVAYVDLNPVVVGEHGAAVLSATVHLRTLARHDDRRELGALT